MIFNQFQDIKLSSLGMGTMRLPVVDEKNDIIDEAATSEMIAYAMDAGINYYDTAWGYHGGNSETVVGKILENYPREQFYLADKFPGYDLSNMDEVESIFTRQLEKCRVEYFDFYLFHNVCEKNIDAYLDKKYGIFDYLVKQKEAGRIKHLGLSVHGSLDVLKRFLDAYGTHIEFCQVQLNYLDWTLQDAKSKVDLLNAQNIPIWVMEPVRGGKLATLTEEERSPLEALRPDESPIAWSYRFLQTIPGVTLTLTGASTLEQLKTNIALFGDEKPLTSKEMEVLLSVAQGMLKETIPCTDCRYCIDHCPEGLDIPKLLSLYNDFRFTGGGFIAPMALSSMPEERRPSACTACRSCEAVCPQQISIADWMEEFAEKVKVD